MKNIAIFIDDYIPDSTKVAAKMMHELSCGFVAKGFNVDVFTPAENVSCKLTHDYIDGVNIYRFKSGVIKNTSMLRRGVNETLISFNAFLNIDRKIFKKKYSIIIYYSPSIFWSGIVAYLKWKSKSFTYLILRDFFPQWIIDNKIISKNSPIAYYFRFFEKMNYNVADVIGIQSERNIEFFEKNYSAKYKTNLLYNWAKLEYHPPGNNSYREKLGLQGKVIFLYGGNIGIAQDMGNLLRLANRMKIYKNAHFLFVGQGDEVDKILYEIKSNFLTNITYISSLSQNEFKYLLSEVDVGLFSLCKTHSSHNFPGKILGYMVNKLPILGSVNPGNDLKDMIDKYNAGYVTINGEDEELYLNAVKLLNDTTLRIKIGENARSLLIKNFTVESAVNTILSNANV
uniref:L-fucosamine transferase n=1 Tax=Yersinia similis TaxID=367190 RepID=S0F2D4_9GAMM|nr:L-fucosamine transferase [Yersinia similis]